MSPIGDILLSPDVRPFAIAAAIMIALGVIEILSMMIGFSMSDLIGSDASVESHDHTGLDGLLLWINAGRLPLLILIVLALALFSVSGFFLQGVAHAFGTSLSVPIAVVLAAAASIPLIRVTSRGLARIIPRDETYVVSDADFVGKVAVVSVGPLDQGLPGRVRLKDAFGNWHTVSARASPDSQALDVGSSVLLVDRDTQSFIAISASPDLTPHQ